MASTRWAHARAGAASLTPWVTFVCDLCIYGSFVFFYAAELVKVDNDKLQKMFPHYNNLGIRYKRIKTMNRLYPYYVFNNIVTCSPLLGGAILVTLTRRLPKARPHEALRRIKRSVRRLLQYQLPPRRLFSWWCGGMTVLDATLVALYVAANAYWTLKPIALNRKTRVLPLREVGLATEYPPYYLYVEWCGLYAGLALFWSLWLLFLPLPHSSFLHTLTGIDYAGMIRYHRWLGHGTMVMTTLHTIPYYVLWTYKGEFLYEFRDWSSHDSINILAGSISWFGGILLWVTSIDYVRRNSFELFYGMHLFGFVVYVVFACIHWMGSYAMFIPGALLWMVDLVNRQASYANVTTVAGAKVNATANTADITLLHSKRSSCPIGHVYFLVPSMSRFQWHPFTVRAQDKEGGLHVSIKDSGPFTRRLLARLARRERVDLRVVAPPHRTPHEWEDQDAVVVVAGGVGVTSAWATLASMAHERAERRARGKDVADLPRSVHAIWVARSPDEFFTIERWVADALEDPDRWFRLTLHCTRKGAKVDAAVGKELSVPPVDDRVEPLAFGERPSTGGASGQSCPPASAAAAAAHAAQADAIPVRLDVAAHEASLRLHDASGSSDDGSSKGEEGKAEEPAGTFSGAIDAAARGLPVAPSEHPGAASGPTFARWNTSPLFFNALRRVQPGGSGDVIWLLTHILVFFGAFMTLLGCLAYYAESITYLTLTGGSAKAMNIVYWKNGLLCMFAIIVGGIGFPYLVLVGPMHVARYVKDRCWRNEAELVQPYCLPEEAPCAVTDCTVRIGDSDVVLPIHPGRPDLRAVVAEAEGDVVGVYASGPETMNHALRCAVNEANTAFGRRYLDFYKLTTAL